MIEVPDLVAALLQDVRFLFPEARLEGQWIVGIPGWDLFWAGWISRQQVAKSLLRLGVGHRRQPDEPLRCLLYRHGNRPDLVLGAMSVPDLDAIVDVARALAPSDVDVRSAVWTLTRGYKGAIMIENTPAGLLSLRTSIRDFELQAILTSWRLFGCYPKRATLPQEAGFERGLLDYNSMRERDAFLVPTVPDGEGGWHG